MIRTRPISRRAVVTVLAAWWGGWGCAGGGDPAPRADYEMVVDRLTRFIERERADKALPAVSIALVDDQEIVWARGFGVANPTDSVPASARTIYRVGSVSKLLTDIAVMQLAERGVVALDSPVTAYIPEFTPRNPHGTPITLRHLMAHRSGLVREPPVGHYFDDTEPTLAATVASLSGTELVYPPATRTKYSNAGVATVGYVLERLAREPFPAVLEQAVLGLLRMDRSGFAAEDEFAGSRAHGRMWSYHGTPWPAPSFELGMAPAGSMYAPVTDLGWFMTALFAGGVGEAGRVLADTTLEEMWTPQFAADTARAGFGIGFAIQQLDGHRMVGHGGAIYGFSTALAALPDVKLGAVAATSLDGSNAVVERIVAYALRLMLAQAEGRPLPTPELTLPLTDTLRAMAPGRYARGGQQIDIVRRGDNLYAWIARPGLRVRLRRRGDTLVVDDRLWYGPRLLPLPAGLVVGDDTLPRVPVRRPSRPPRRWTGLIGEYGWDYNTLYILERNGGLHALIEWFFLYPLRELGRDLFAFPDWGLYHGERLQFARNDAGRATHVVAAGVRFDRRDVEPEAGRSFTITPMHPVDSLREVALAASPPAQTGPLRDTDLVELRSLDPTIRYDIRYAGTNNFMRARFYDEPRALLQRPAAEALVRAHRRVRASGYGFLIHDAYRPWYVTKMFWDATPPHQRQFVANPADGSRHNRGAAIDLTLFDLSTGRPVEMVGGYDEFSDRSYPEYPGGTSLQRWHRELLRDAMEAEGFRVYRFEWWHFDYQDWRAYPIMNVEFDAISRREP